MEKTELTVSELSSLFRMLQVISDAKSVDKIHQMLLAFCTAWRSIGFERSFLLLVDRKNRVVRGHVAAERPMESSVASDDPTFKEMAKVVFDSYEAIESSDLSLKARTYSVPLDWHRSAVVKAVASGYPVLAERAASEFATDPFFAFFATPRYVALPLSVDGTVTAVLAVDHGAMDKPIGVDDISLTYSLVQQAAVGIERFLEAMDSRRKFRVLRKLQEMMHNARTPSQLAEAQNIALSMIGRAVGATGAFLKDLIRNRTIHIKTVDEYSLEATDADIVIAECFDRVLERAAGSMKPVRGDGQHALLDETTGEIVRHFESHPLTTNGDSLGALAVYVEATDDNTRKIEFDGRSRLFLELSAGIIADKLNSMHKSQRIGRSETVLEEVRSHLSRERETSRAASRAADRYEHLVREVRELKDAVDSHGSDEDRIQLVKKVLRKIENEADDGERELRAIRSSLRMIDLFTLVERASSRWASKLRDKGVSVTVRIPAAGPTLLMNPGNLTTALSNILRVLCGAVVEGDRVLIECSTTDEKASIVIADTGTGLPGSVLSRLFMPFSEGGAEGSDSSAMTAAGDILSRHHGEIAIKSSPSWKTILVISFPLPANTDRRETRDDRRRKREDRRGVTANTTDS